MTISFTVKDPEKLLARLYTNPGVNIKPPKSTDYCIVPKNVECYILDRTWVESLKNDSILPSRHEM